MTHISFKDLTNDFKSDIQLAFRELTLVWDIEASDVQEYMNTNKVVYFSSNYSTHITTSDPIDIFPFVINNINSFVLFDDLSLYVEYNNGKKSIYHIESVYELNNYLG